VRQPQRLPTRHQVTDLLAAEDRPLHAREVAERLGVGDATYSALLRLLDDLVFDGVLTVRGGQRFKIDTKRAGLRKTDRERREGVLKVNPRGFGFVASQAASGDDVFIPEGALGGAMHGDRVVVDLVARTARGAEGQIVEVKERGSPRVSGILRRRGKSAWVEPDDPRVRGPVVLTSDVDLRGPEGNSGQEGQVVVAQITRFPGRPDENPEGKLVAVLGVPGELSVEVKKVLLVEGVEEVHSESAIAEAEAFGVDVPEHMLAGREDLGHIPLPTIDPEDARDHDDAVWVERTPSGGYEVWVAIADVSSYVQPGTKLDDEARARGCSIYLPDRAIPMLPRALSSNLCSLLPDVVRLCLCVHAELDARGHVRRSRLVRGYMKSAAKLTYGGVARALGFSADEKLPRQPKAEELAPGLRVAHELARVLRGRRMKRGALDFDLPEAVVKLDGEGKPSSIAKRAQDPGVKKAYQLIEELMIFANEVVARWLVENQLHGVFRVHLPPDPQKLDRLAAMCEVLGLELDVEDTQTPKGLAEVLKSFADHPLSGVLNQLLLRSMKQATYDVQNLGHFGLASEAYLHFTSPIRRYPDLVVHRVVHAALEPNEKERRRALAKTTDLEKLTEAAAQSSMAERRAMEIEREIVDVYRCFYMIDRIGERFEGTVSAFVGAGAFVTLDDPFVDVMVRVEDMGPDFQIEDDGLMATAARSGDTIRLGDRLVVDIADVAILRRTVYARRVRGEGQHEDAGRQRPRHRPEPRRGDNHRPERGKQDTRHANGSRKPFGKKKKPPFGGKNHKKKGKRR
jgi:ribonuclease R